MHTTFTPQHSTERGIPMRGRFYPSDDTSSHGIPAVLPKLMAALVVMAVIRTVAATLRGHAGSSHRSRRRDAIAKLHQELHAQEAGGEASPA